MATFLPFQILSSLAWRGFASIYLKGQYHEIFCFRFFSWIIFPQAPENNIVVISNLPPVSMALAANFATSTAGVVNTGSTFSTSVNDIDGKIATGVNDTVGKLLPVSTTAAANLPPVSTTMGTLSDCWHLKVNLKKKIIYMLTLCTTQRCPNKIIKTFLIEDFFHLLLMVHLELRISLPI